MNPRAFVRRHSLLTGLLAASLLVTLAGCSRAPGVPDAAVQSLNADALLKHIRTLSSDEWEGRGPGSKGEELTVKYLDDQFRGMGLEPGNPGGGYVQKVPLVGITPDPKMKLTFSGRGRTLEPKFQDDFVAWTKRVVDAAAIDAEMIFVGYGVQAPEFQWDDFKGADVKGKVIVVLINDPPVPDEKLFGGKAMTYYGRWTYKFEKAAELGAAACLIIHETERAGYPWEVVRNSWSGEQFDLSTPDKNLGRVAVEGWITGEQAAALFKLAGKDLAALKQAAVSRDFQPAPLGVRAKLAIHNTLRMVDSRNVLGKVTGSDPKLKDEYVIYVAHWDHFGIGPEVKGDKIYHGAKDNASGTAALLEIARAYKRLQTSPRRSLLFLAVTAEEQGLLGSRYYSEHPLYPLARTAAAINMDSLNVFGRTADIVMIGRGASTLDEVVEGVAREQGRTVKGDQEPEKGFFYRSDHFSFAKQGVPAFDPGAGVDYVGKPPGWGMEMRRKYTLEDYHKPSDKVKDYWDLSGAVQDSQLYFLVGYRVANDPRMPEWRPGAEFKATRDASLRQAGAGR
ncbi:MAG: M28 family peptidase [Acidobacteria bacterium]|nr:M28 family peptidase [Acidobacteriota bacterium]